MAKELYRVRLNWNNSKSQIGAYSVLKNAKNACDKAGKNYKVYNSQGKVIYPVAKQITSTIKTTTTDPLQMWNYFKSQGLNDYGIAGLMGNLYAESGLKACNLQNGYEKSLNMNDIEYTAAVDSGAYTNFIYDQAGYGLAQWTYWSLKKDLLEYHQKKGKSIGDLNTQMEFLVYQLSTSYKAVWTTLKNAKNVREASDAVLLQFERPVDQSEQAQKQRAAFGQSYFNKYGKKIQINIPKEGGKGNMKYSTSNKPLVCMQTQSTCYKGTSIMTVKGVLWHSTGANNSTLKRYVQPSDNAPDKNEMLELIGKNLYRNDWNHISIQAGLNCWIGELEDGTVTTIQTMPWNYKPWGCGSGPKGSCNNGWIQFEICEDSLADRSYFEKVYKEACEITAYLCKMYNINPKGTVTVNGVNVPTILCHADSNALGFGSDHADVLHWFSKFDKTMEDVRNDVAKLMRVNAAAPAQPIKPEPQKELYRVRKSWDEPKSQIGAYSVLQNAIDACKEAGPDYEVYNSNGIAVYPEKAEKILAQQQSSFKIGEAVKLIPGATYTSGQAIPNWLFRSKLYVREIYDSGDIIISTQKSGAITGVVSSQYLVTYNGTVSTSPSFTPYLVRINADVLNVRAGAGTGYRITTQVKRHEIYTIVNEKDNWGKLKSGAGWISLNYVKKV